MRRLLACIFLLSLAVFSAAQEVYQGVFTVEFGKVRQPDGTYLDVSGLQIPYTARKVKAIEAIPGLADLQIGQGSGAGTDGSSTVYLNDKGDGTYVYFPGNPSTLEDIDMTTAGDGTPWQELTIGFNRVSTDRIIIRWRIWDDQISTGNQPFVNAFSNEIADFGGYFDHPEYGVDGMVITFDISIMGLSVPDGKCFLATQFRDPVASGEGDFREDYDVMFSGTGPANIGTTEYTFFYDSDGGAPDGIYAENEIDYFAEPPGETNAVIGIKVGGTAQDGFLASHALFNGKFISGNSTINLALIDSLNTVIESYRDSRMKGMLLQGDALGVSNPLSVQMRVNCSVNKPGIIQELEMYNFTQQKWVTVDTRFASLTQKTASGVVTANPAEYIDPTDPDLPLFRGRVRFTPFGPKATHPYRATVNYIGFRFVTP